MLYFPYDVLLLKCLCIFVWKVYGRRDVYFLNIYYICVIYRFNRSRVLQVGIGVMSILSGQKPGELPVVF